MNPIEFLYVFLVASRIITHLMSDYYLWKLARMKFSATFTWILVFAGMVIRTCFLFTNIPHSQKIAELIGFGSVAGIIFTQAMLLVASLCFTIAFGRIYNAAKRLS
jgi:hypothetical protein